MTNEDKFILNIQKEFGFPFTNEVFRKQFVKRDSILNSIINIAIEKNIEFIPAFADVLDDAITGNLHLTSKTIIGLCDKFGYINQTTKLGDDFIVKLCTINLAQTHNKIDHIRSQLKICKKINNIEQKINTSKEIYSNLLAIDNNSKNQKIIFDDWNSMSLNEQEISHLIPLFINEKPAINSEDQRISTIHINCNMLANQFSVKTVHTVLASRKFISLFEVKFPSSIMFTNEKKDDCSFTVYIDNSLNCEKFIVCLNHFLHKINDAKLWFEPGKFEVIIENDWESVLFSEKLKLNLNDKPTTKKPKI